MRATATGLALVAAAAAVAGCLRNTEFRCTSNSECGAGGACEMVGYCSVPDPACVGTGRAYGESAGQNLASTCVPVGMTGPGPDAGVDAAIDAPPAAGCPPSYMEVAGSLHRYRALANVSWDEAAAACRQASADAYLAIPDDAAELVNLATVATAPFWIGLDDKAAEDTFVTQKGAVATFTPWQMDQPDDDQPGEDCVSAVSGTEITDERCGGRKAAVCECEP
jgi:hypothetical protein